MTHWRPVYVHGVQELWQSCDACCVYQQQWLLWLVSCWVRMVLGTGRRCRCSCFLFIITCGKVSRAAGFVAVHSCAQQTAEVLGAFFFRSVARLLGSAAMRRTAGLFVELSAALSWYRLGGNVAFLLLKTSCCMQRRRQARLTAGYGLVCTASLMRARMPCVSDARCGLFGTFLCQSAWLLVRSSCSTAGVLQSPGLSVPWH